MNARGFDDNQRPVLIADFDWDQVERNLTSEKKEIRGALRNGELTEEDFDRALQLSGTLMRWIWQNGKRDIRGLSIRSIIVCWHFIYELRDLPLTTVAAKFGKHKQSLGRWLDRFKNDFPRWRIAATRSSNFSRSSAENREAVLLFLHHANCAAEFASKLASCGDMAICKAFENLQIQQKRILPAPGKGISLGCPETGNGLPNCPAPSCDADQKPVSVSKKTKSQPKAGT